MKFVQRWNINSESELWRRSFRNSTIFNYSFPITMNKLWHIGLYNFSTKKYFQN